jgi:HD-GYP domain-containing protein (c-di-GMP phosphodiesterase class II)
VLDELAAARQLATQLEQTVLENEGLAEEVLQNYEQLGVLLDVTHEIAGLTRTEDLERVVFGRLGQLLSADEVVIISSRQTLQRFVTADGQFRVPEELPATSRYHTLLEQAPGTAGVSITPVDDRQVLSFMLSAFEGQHEVVLVERPAGAAEFSAGEVRIAEALLSFAGNIINNSKLHDRIRRMSLEATRALVYAIDKKDRYTSGHSQRVGFMARLTGEALGLPVAELDQLEWSGLLHDIGKIGVPEEILNKPGKLTDAEFDEIKKHPQMGYDILAPIKAFEHILGGVLSHHENEDGTGYPHALQGDEIPLFGRIIHVVDVFDALSSTRSYRQAFSVDRALEIVLSMSGEKMYAPAVQAFEVALNDFRYLQPDAFKAMFYFALDDEAGGLLAGETP